LAYRNGSQLGLWRFATAGELLVDPGERPGIGNVGVGVSRSGRVSVLRDGSGVDEWLIVLYDLGGNQVDALRVQRELAFPISAATLDDAGARLAFAVDEPASASVSTRITRTLVVDVTSGAVLARLDGVEDPVFGGAAGTLFVRDSASGRLRVLDASYGGARTLPVEPEAMVGSYDVSADGRRVAYARALDIWIHDIETGSDRIAVTDGGSELFSPAFSPDGTRLAVLATLVTSRVPHVVALDNAAPVALTSALALPDTIVECGGRMGWAG
jgi:dipeptidyl aminopeptidase/acylaminoacyl peptidase